METWLRCTLFPGQFSSELVAVVQSVHGREFSLFAPKADLDYNDAPDPALPCRGGCAWTWCKSKTVCSSSAYRRRPWKMGNTSRSHPVSCDGFRRNKGREASHDPVQPRNAHCPGCETVDYHARTAAAGSRRRKPGRLLSLRHPRGRSDAGERLHRPGSGNVCLRLDATRPARGFHRKELQNLPNRPAFAFRSGAAAVHIGPNAGNRFLAHRPPGQRADSDLSRRPDRGEEQPGQGGAARFTLRRRRFIRASAAR